MVGIGLIHAKSSRRNIEWLDLIDGLSLSRMVIDTSGRRAVNVCYRFPGYDVYSKHCFRDDIDFSFAGKIKGKEESYYIRGNSMGGRV